MRRGRACGSSSVSLVRSAFVAFAAAALIAVTGCGTQTGAGTAADPASVAPSSSLAFATFQIAPQGPEKAGFDAAFGKLLGPAPEAQLGAAFTDAAQTSGRLDYLADVKPWLGDSISAFVTRVSQDGADYALLVASTDDAAAQAAIDKDVAGQGAQSRTYRDISYKALPDGTVNGVVDHFLVAGTEPAFKQVVDTVKDGNSLADSDQWKSSVGNRGDGKVGLAYVDAKGLLQSALSTMPGAARLAGPFLVGLLQLHPFVATLDAQPDRLVVDVSSPGTTPDPRGPGAASSQLIEALPADSWLAAGLPQVGPALSRIADALKANPLIAAQYQRVLAQVRANTGIDIEKDVLATVGDVALFAHGESPHTVGGGLVIQSPQPARLAATIARLPALIRAKTGKRVRMTANGAGFDLQGPQMPQPVQVRVSRKGVIATYGAAATRAAAHPSARLGSTALFQKAAAAIGQRPTLFVDFGSALKLAAQSPRHAQDAHFQKALPHLEHVEYVAVGARRDDGLDVVRAVVGLR
jgi:hypothetical protein